MADKYELRVEGLATTELVPICDALYKLADENESLGENDNSRYFERERQAQIDKLKKAKAPEGIMDYIGATLGGKSNPFTVAHDRILPVNAEWGSLTQSPEDDVRELSRMFPTNIFFLTVFSEMEEYGNVESLENLQRIRIQDGQITAIYDAEPVVWTSRYGY